jgi:ATP/maltotriose-dependent transcriptional regulator MalT
MEAPSSTIPLILTKLHRHPLPRDLVRRAGSVAWLSLDEADGDLRMFLSYVVAAV